MRAADALPRTDPLAPVREALLARAHAEADGLRSQSEADAAAIVAKARVEADAIRAEARAQGEADAVGVLVAERARLRRQARGAVLTAQRDVYDALRAEVVRRLPNLRVTPAYRSWRDDMTQRVRDVLGPEASVTEHPDGGVLGELPGRRVGCTLATLADDALDALGADLEGLWSP